MDGVDLDDLLLNAGDVRRDVLVEKAVVLLLALPDLGNRETAIAVHERDVVPEPRRTLHLLHERRRDLVVLRGGSSPQRGVGSAQP